MAADRAVQMTDFSWRKWRMLVGDMSSVCALVMEDMAFVGGEADFFVPPVLLAREDFPLCA